MKHSRHSLRIFVAASIATLALSSCGPNSKPTSRLDEAPDEFNAPKRLGLKGPFPWQKIKGPVSAALDYKPWTDSYWPTYLKGMAFRFQEDLPKGYAIFSFHDFLAKFFKVIDGGEESSMAKLSPAEKHDFLIAGGRGGIPAELRKSLLAEAEQIDTKLRESIEAIGAGNAKAIRDQKIKVIREAMVKIRELIQGTPELESKLPLIASSWRQWASVASDEDNKVQSRLDHLILDGTDVIDPKADDWGWEGICHGWAPAALMEKEPKYAVHATKGDADVFFTQGDLRGLLSKAWADQAPWRKEVFIGARCNTANEEIQYDRFGRTLDAKIACENCELDAAGLHFKREFQLGGKVVYLYSIWGDSVPDRYLVRLRWATNWNGGEDHSKFYGVSFNSFAKLKAWLKDPKAAEDQKVAVKMQTQCRDLNPMTLHLLLTQKMSKGVGFVMDRTRSLEVWNQPISEYELEYASIAGSKAKAGELTSVKEIADEFWNVRAAGTAFLANVKVDLYWTGENGPYTNYEFPHESDLFDIDAMSVKDDIWEYPTIRRYSLHYTLEFDKNKNLIGGEWGWVPVAGQPQKPQTRNGQVPDFIYYYEPGTKPVNAPGAPLDYENIVSKLHACSIDDNADVKTSRLVDEWGQPLKYVECSLD